MGRRTSFRVTTQANTVPVVGSIADQSVKVGVTKNISSLVKATDMMVIRSRSTG